MPDTLPDSFVNHVLIVEDDLVTARVCQAYLKQGQYTSRHATTGAEAIDELSKKTIP